MKTNRFALITICLVAFVSPVRAEDEKDLDADTESARRHYQKGAEHYAGGEYAKALDEFEAAKVIKPVAAFDFNIARCHDRMEHWEEAIRAFQRYIDARPNDPPGVEESRTRIGVLQQRLEKLKATPPPPPRVLTVERIPSPPPSASIVPVPASDTGLTRGQQAVLGVVGAGAVALVGLGAGFLAWESGDYNRLNQTCLRPCQDALLSDLEKRWAAGWTMVGLGVAVGVADLALGLVWRRQLHRNHVKIVPNLNPNSAGLTIGGNF